MDTAQLDTLSLQLADTMENGTEAGARQFLTSHFSEFPEDMQGEILRGFLMEGVEQALHSDAVISEAREDASDLLMRMDRLRRMLEDKKKLLELEDKMK